MYHGIDHRYGYRANVLQVHTSNTELTTDLTYLILSYGCDSVAVITDRSFLTGFDIHGAMYVCTDFIVHKIKHNPSAGLLPFLSLGYHPQCTDKSPTTALWSEQ